MFAIVTDPVPVTPLMSPLNVVHVAAGAPNITCPAADAAASFAAVTAPLAISAVPTLVRLASAPSALPHANCVPFQMILLVPAFVHVPIDVTSKTPSPSP